MDKIARAISGGAMLLAGVALTIFASRGGFGKFQFILTILGLLLLIVGLCLSVAVAFSGASAPRGMNEMRFERSPRE